MKFFSINIFSVKFFRDLFVRCARFIWLASISLRTAITIILLLTLSLIIATSLESIYDTATAQYWVYQSFAFQAILVALGLNIFCVAVSRWPWKPRHTPFLLAHLGILTLLYGSFLTQRIGLDGNMRLTEGEASNEVEVNNLLLNFVEKDHIERVPVKWIPPHVEFKSKDFKKYGLVMDRFLSHADSVVKFLPAVAGLPAVKVLIQGGAMRINQEYWLYAGDLSWSNIQAGPARLSLDTEESQQRLPDIGTALQLAITVLNDGRLKYDSRSSAGKRTGILKSNQVRGAELDLGWKGGVRLSIVEYIPHAQIEITYQSSKIQFGPNAPSSAIRLSVQPAKENSVWLGLGDHATLTLNGREVSVSYTPQYFILPFALKLERFQIDHYEGTLNPMSYSSKVRIVGLPEEITISMNEPLTHQGVSIYQASYEDAQPRPVVSIFSVNRDPGRVFKYVGSLLIVLGAILLFSMKYIKKKRARQSDLVGVSL